MIFIKRNAHYYAEAWFTSTLFVTYWQVSVNGKEEDLLAALSQVQHQPSWAREIE